MFTAAAHTWPRRGQGAARSSRRLAKRSFSFACAGFVRTDTRKTRAKLRKGFREPDRSRCLILAAEVEMADALVRFLEKATEDPGLFEELVKLAARYGIDLTELDDDLLGDVSGGTALALDRAGAAQDAAIEDYTSRQQDAKQAFKLSIKILNEHNERQSQVTQKITS
jgi:hypothetical protein